VHDAQLLLDFKAQKAI